MNLCFLLFENLARQFSRAVLTSTVAEKRMGVVGITPHHQVLQHPVEFANLC